MPHYDPALVIPLIALLALSVWAMWAWGRVWEDQATARIKWAAAASACWFAMCAATIALLFDISA